MAENAGQVTYTRAHGSPFRAEVYVIRLACGQVLRGGPRTRGGRAVDARWTRGGRAVRLTTKIYKITFLQIKAKSWEIPGN